MLVAAAYNAGSPRRADHPGNRWRLYCYPPESGDHLNRFVGWFNDAMALSRSMDWSAGGTPTFVAAFAAAASDEPAKPGATGTLTTSDAAAQTSAAAAATLGAVTASLPIARIGAEKPLAVAVQQKLTEHGYLDPPPDGDFRSVSLWAIAEFCKRNGLPSDVLGPDTAQTLLVPRAPLAQPRLKGDWIDRVIDYMNRNNYLVQPLPRLPQHRLPRGRRRGRSAERGRVRPVQRPARGLSGSTTTGRSRIGSGRAPPSRAHSTPTPR